MENAIGCIVGNAYTSMLSSTGRHLSSAIWGKVSCFVAGAVAGAGVTYYGGQNEMYILGVSRKLRNGRWIKRLAQFC